MRRMIGIAVMALVLIAGISVFSSASAGDGDSSNDGQTFRLLAKTVQAAELDLGDTGLSLGDQFVFTDDLFLKGKLVGSDHGFCMITRVEEGAHQIAAECVVTAVLDGKGQITVQGVAVFQETATAPFTLAITGGTDRFRGASGQVKVRELSDTEAILRVQLGD
jgi:hypothetical protein